MRALRLPNIGATVRFHDLPGTLPPLLFVGGFGVSGADAFVEVAAHPQIAGRRRVLVDLLGFGVSDKPETYRYTLEDHAATLAAVADHRDLGACIVIAHSWGGSVAIVLAMRRPELVHALVLAEGNLGEFGVVTRPVAAQSEAEYVATGHRALLQDAERAERDEPFVALVRGYWQVASPLAMHRSARAIGDAGKVVRDRFLSMPVPRYYLVGERTDWTGLRTTLAALSDAGVHVVTVPNVGHGMFDDDVDSFAEVLAGALKTVPAAHATGRSAPY